MKQIDEKTLQKSVHNYLSNPQKIFKTVSGKRLQILSPGNINIFEGPDFKDSAFLIDGTLRVGDSEFHRKSSDWNNHNHQNDKNYKNVVLHVVFTEDKKIINEEFETLILGEEIIIENIANLISNDTNSEIVTLEELQHYSLLRLLRKTSEAQRILNANNLQKALYLLTDDFLKRYISRRKRPAYNEERLNKILNGIYKSIAMEFLEKLEKKVQVSIPDFMIKLLKTKIFDEGPHLRREILLNAVLPLSLCLANESARIDLFLWYWSTPSLNQYGILNRKFSGLPQNYIWQQQGMLEFMKQYGKKQNIVAESIRNYGFAEVLSFYKLGNSPFKSTLDD